MNGRRTRGFTLVELLVVVGIIALLISILLPVLKRAREAASRDICLSNHKQIATAFIMYANDNKQRLPYCIWGGDPGAGQNPTHGYAGWLFDPRSPNWGPSNPPTLDGRGGTNWPGTGALWRGKYITTAKVYRCPFDHEDSWKNPKGPVHAISSIGANGAINGYGRAGCWTRLSQFKADDILLWEPDIDWDSGFYFNDGSNYPREGISRRHGSGKGLDTGAIVAGFDGSARWWTLRQYYTEAHTNPATRNEDGWNGTRAGTRSHLWCTPSQIDPNGH